MFDAAALHRENAELREQLAALRGQLAQLLTKNGDLVETIAKLNERVTELLAVAQRKQRKAPAAKPPEIPRPSSSPSRQRTGSGSRAPTAWNGSTGR